MSIAEEKSKMRENLIKKRLSASKEEVKNISLKITENLKDLVDFSKIENIHIYQTIADKKEVDTKYFVEWIERNYPEININYSPKTKPYEMPFSKNYDLVVVPVVGFDKHKNRLGYGGGYYDKLLANNSCSVTVGIAYSFSEVDNIPAESHDQKLDQIITEAYVISS